MAAPILAADTLFEATRPTELRAENSEQIVHQAAIHRQCCARGPLDDCNSIWVKACAAASRRWKLFAVMA